jgi:hypothetical protein
MSDPKLLRRVKLGSQHQPTGKTRHFCGALELPAPHELRIVQYANDPGYYLFYCDETGKEFTDTYHDTLEESMAQADWEFGVKRSEWEVLGL